MQDKPQTSFAVIQQKGAVIFEKSTYGLNQEQIEMLKNKDKYKKIYLCGTDLDACVLAIAYQLFDNGIKPLIILDCCGSSSSNKEIVKNTQDIFIRNFGKDCIVK